MRGRLGRGGFWRASLGLGGLFVASFLALQALAGRSSTLLLYPPFFWAALALASRRLHDRGLAAAWLLASAIPILGPTWVAVQLWLLRGTARGNAYGPGPERT